MSTKAPVDDWPRLRIIKAERINYAPTAKVAQVDRHAHSWHELLCPLRGSYTVELGDGRHYDGQPGSVFVYAAGQQHHGRWLAEGGATDFFLICWQGPMADPAPPVHSCLPIDRLHHCCAWILDNHCAGDEAGRRVAAMLLQALLLDLSRQSRRRDELVQIVDSIVDQTRDRRVRLADLAEGAGLSRFHFTRRFKEQTGLSPMVYVRRRRLTAVYRDLIDSDLPIAQLARQHRFATPQQLATMMRKYYGLSPRQIRQRGAG